MVLNKVRHNQVVPILLGNGTQTLSLWERSGCQSDVWRYNECRMEGAALGSPVHVGCFQVSVEKFLSPFRATVVFEIALTDISPRKQVQAETIRSTKACCASRPGVLQVAVSQYAFHLSRTSAGDAFPR